ncbi:hypothetical protein HN51_066776 [Arachis hypogaea]
MAPLLFLNYPKPLFIPTPLNSHSLKRSSLLPKRNTSLSTARRGTLSPSIGPSSFLSPLTLFTPIALLRQLRSLSLKPSRSTKPPFFVKIRRCSNSELLCISKLRSKFSLGFGGKALIWLIDALKSRTKGCPDFILIDCPAGIDAGFITAIMPVYGANNKRRLPKFHAAFGGK